MPGPRAVQRTRRASRTPPAPAVEQSSAGADSAATPEPSEGQTTREEPAAEPVSWRAKLSKDELEAARKEIAGEIDPDEYVKVNDRAEGYIGKRLQVKAAEDEKARKERELLETRTRAAKDRDPDAALEYIDATTQAEVEKAQQSAWSGARKVYDTIAGNEITRPLLDALATAPHAALAPRTDDGQVDYGALANGDGYTASLMYRADVADTIVSALPDWEKRIREDERAKAEAEWKKAEKEIRSATEREVRARLRGEEPVPDPGAGAAPGSAGLPKTVPEMRAFIARLPASEYQKRESELDAHLAALLRGRRAA